MRRVAIGILLALVTAAGCSFQVTPAAGDAPLADAFDAPDAPPVSVVAFAGATTTADETSGAITVPVTLSPSAAGQVTVDFAITGGTATRGAGLDFAGGDGTLTFASGETVQSIPLTILADAAVESDETIVITLSGPMGANVGASTHTVTISQNTLPRVSLTMPTSTGGEGTMPMIQFALDTAATTIVTVDFTVGGTASTIAPFQDHMLAPQTITFPIGSVMQVRSLTVVNDTRDELDETVVIALTNPVGAIIGSTPMRTHTITDNDPTPTVAFELASRSIPEGDAGSSMVTVNVTLSAASGRNVVVPFVLNAGGTTAMDPADYTVSAPPLTFPEGVVTQTLTLRVVGDMVDEPNETIALTLQAGLNGTANLGTPVTHAHTIANDDGYCVGTGAFAVCIPPPTLPVVLPALLDTDTSLLCAVTQPMTWTTTQAQPPSCFVAATNITMLTDTVVTGSRPLVLVASGNISISQTLDVATHRGSTVGPAAPSSACRVFPQAPNQGDSSGGGGGAGASFMTRGGNGGVGNGGNQAGTPPLAETIAPAALRGGCDGQVGGPSGGTTGLVGRGGGAVYLAASGTLTISGAINASGSGAEGTMDFAGGSGAGSGGMIVLQAMTYSLTGGVVIANGGGGSQGATNHPSQGDGGAGADPMIAAPQAAAPGGSSGGQAGGFGGDGFPAAQGGPIDGNNGASNEGGGGGGGGGGYVRSNVALTNATVSAGRIDVIP